MSDIRQRVRWSDREDRYVRRYYRKVPVEKIAASLNRSVKSVYLRAMLLGLTTPNRINAPDFPEFLKSKNAEGWSDSEIAKAWGSDRHGVTRRRLKMGLPYNGRNERWRQKIRLMARRQLERAGLKSMGEIRAKAFRDRAAAQGWPEDLSPRAVQILNTLWDRGPLTRRELADAIGMPWKGSRKSLCNTRVAGGSYLADLMRRGLVVCLGKVAKGKGRGHSRCVYSLPLWIERKVG